MHTTSAASTTALRTALDFARESLDLSDPKDGLIFDLQNTDAVLREHGSELSFLRGQCERLIESRVWNADELQQLLDSAPAEAFSYHGALQRSLQSKF
jgi:hypothetical protein